MTENELLDRASELQMRRDSLVREQEWLDRGAFTAQEAKIKLVEKELFAVEEELYDRH